MNRCLVAPSVKVPRTWRVCGVTLRDPRISHVDRVTEPRPELLPESTQYTRRGRQSIREKVVEPCRGALDTCRRELSEGAQGDRCLWMESAEERTKRRRRLNRLWRVGIADSILRLNVVGSESDGSGQKHEPKWPRRADRTSQGQISIVQDLRLASRGLDNNFPNPLSNTGMGTKCL